MSFNSETATPYELREACKRLQQWVNDMQTGLTVNCVYCGHNFGPVLLTSVSKAEMLKRHVEQCPEHPMSTLKHVASQLADALKLLDDTPAKAIECHYNNHGVAKLALELWQSYLDGKL